MKKKTKILVVEDELIIAMTICDHLESMGYQIIKSVNSYEAATAFLKSNTIDLAILDIHLKTEKSGIDLASYLRQIMNIPIVFLSSKSDPQTISEVKKVSPEAYLVKPFTCKDLYTTITLALHNHQIHSSHSNIKDEHFESLQDGVYIKSNGKLTKVKYTEILFAKSEHVYIEIHTLDGGTHLIRSTMKDFETEIPNQFHRTHRSYLINLRYLNAVEPQHVKIANHQIPLSKSYRQKLLNKIDTLS